MPGASGRAGGGRAGGPHTGTETLGDAAVLPLPGARGLPGRRPDRIAGQPASARRPAQGAERGGGGGADRRRRAVTGQPGAAGRGRRGTAVFLGSAGQRAGDLAAGFDAQRLAAGDGARQGRQGAAGARLEPCAGGGAGCAGWDGTARQGAAPGGAVSVSGAGEGRAFDTTGPGAAAEGGGGGGGAGAGKGIAPRPAAFLRLAPVGAWG